MLRHGYAFFLKTINAVYPQTIANIKLTIFFMKMQVKLQRRHPIIIGKNNIIITALINCNLLNLTLNYIFNIFFNIQFLLEHFSL